MKFFLQFLRGTTGGISPANQSADAGSRKDMNRNSLLFKYL